MSGSTTGVFIGGMPPATSANLSDLIPVQQGATIGTPGTGTTRYATIAQCLANVPPGADSYPVLPNIAALISYSGPAQVVFVAGYYTSSDGGQGSFFLNGGDTTSVSNGGTIIVNTAGQRWIRDTINSGVINVRWFGVMPGADYTTLLQGAITQAQAGGQAVYFPGSASAYIVTSQVNITAPCEIFGDAGTSSIQTTNLTSNMFNISGSYVTFGGLNLSTSSTATAGSLINLASVSNIKIHDCVFSGYNVGVNASASFQAILKIEDCYFGNGAPSVGIGIQINAGFDIEITNVTMNSGLTPQPTAGINIQACGDTTIRGCNIIQQGRGLLLNPASGQVVASVWCTDTFFDTCSQYGALVDGSGTGVVVRSRFIGCWFSSAGIRGFSSNNAATGTVTGIDFIDCHAFGNTMDGWYLFYGSGFTLIGCQAGGNGTAAVSVGGGISGFTITGCTLGPCGGFGANQYGVFIGTGPSDHFIVANNSLQGNTTGAFINGASGTNVITTPNLLT